MSTHLRLRDLGSTYGGLTGKSKSDFGTGEASFVTFLEVINNTRLRGNALERVQVDKSERQNRVMRGDVLFNGSSETPEEVALSAVVDFDPGADVYLNSFCFGFRLRPNAPVVPEYLAYLFRSPTGRSLLAALAQGATRYNIAKTKFLDVKVGLPALERQCQIVESLGQADDLIGILERMIVKKQSLKLGMMQQLLTGRTRLPGFNSAWRRTTVGEIADVKTGPFGSALHEDDYVRSGTPIITVEHLGDRGVIAEEAPMVSEEDRYRLRAYGLRTGDVVFSRVGAIDRNALISAHEEGWLFSGRLLRVRFDLSKADPVFMSAQFHGQAFREAVRSVAVGQTMASLNTAILRGVEVDLPPVDEQRRIGGVFDDVNDALDALEARLHKAQLLKQGMLHDLLADPSRMRANEVAA